VKKKTYVVKSSGKLLLCEPLRIASRSTQIWVAIYRLRNSRLRITQRKHKNYGNFLRCRDKPIVHSRKECNMV